jgi:CheY-like chemotaxis protein
MGILDHRPTICYGRDCRNEAFPQKIFHKGDSCYTIDLSVNFICLDTGTHIQYPYPTFTHKKFSWSYCVMENEIMNERSPLKGKLVLVVDDEPDVLESVKEILHMCILHTASNHDTALTYILSYTYDIVILDIMGVDGFDLLKKTISRGFPAVMLTAHALTPEALKKSIKLGAVSFLPKERMPELVDFLENVILDDKKTVWKKLFDRFGEYFNRRFGPDWKEKDRFFREFESTLTESEGKNLNR